jgi:DNA-binding transcriptional LysR family regulator
LDLRSLACAAAVAETLSFRRAAARLNIAQPALSQRIRVLEGEIGVALFQRDRRGVVPTAAGEAFLEPARRAVELAALARRRARDAARGEAGRLRLGFTVIAFHGFLPEAVRLFRQRHPEVTIDLTELNSPALERALASGEIDLGVLHPPVSTPGLSMQALPDDPLVLALPEGHTLAASASICVRDLAGVPFLLAPRQIGPSIYDRIIALFQGEGVTPSIVQEVMPMTSLVGLVSAGVGIGFVTQGISRGARPGVTFRPVHPPAPTLPLAAAWYGDRPSPQAERFLRSTREAEGSAQE